MKELIASVKSGRKVVDNNVETPEWLMDAISEGRNKGSKLKRYINIIPFRYGLQTVVSAAYHLVHLQRQIIPSFKIKVVFAEGTSRPLV